MKIALIGYGKMGKAIEAAALERQHSIQLRIDADNQSAFVSDQLKLADVAIEFTTPETAVPNILRCFDAGIPVVCGTTGWLREYDSVLEACRAGNRSFLYASNFSIGVNLFFHLNAYLARLMAPYTAYEPGITEIHHTQKKDAPSGTAITLANQILDASARKSRWVNHISDDPADLEITSERVDPYPGRHEIRYRSAIDDIEIIHTAHNRMGFALGAILAAEFISNKQGVFTMDDVLGLSKVQNI